MAEDVKRALARSYDSTRRRQQAGQNRGAVLAAARRRFLAEGYAAATLNEIAADAGVSVQMVYKSFGNKAGLLKALFDLSVAGDDDAIAMRGRDIIKEITREPDARRKITLYARHLAEAMPRVAPVQLLARDAAAADPGAAEVWAQTRRETLTAMTLFARDLADTGQLRLSVKHARDVLWAFHAPEQYELLVLERQWTTKRYAQFLADALSALLVAPSASP